MSFFKKKLVDAVGVDASTEVGKVNVGEETHPDFPVETKDITSVPTAESKGTTEESTDTTSVEKAQTVIGGTVDTVIVNRKAFNNLIFTLLVGKTQNVVAGGVRPLLVNLLGIKNEDVTAKIEEIKKERFNA